VKIHRIRLAGFWTAAPTPDGRTAHTRSFGRPRTVGEGETVWVVTATPGDVSVNGVLLGVGVEVLVGVELLPRNRLTIVTAGELGEVAIEVRCASGDALRGTAGEPLASAGGF